MTKILDLDFQRNRSYPDTAPISGRNVTEIGFPRRASSHLSVTRANPAVTYAENVDGTLTSFAANQARITDKGLLAEEIRTNIFLNSFTPATQTVTVTNATEYTFSMRGTGSLALTGGATGTVTEGSPVTVTTSSTSVTATLTGSATFMQAEIGGTASSPIPTTSTAVTRDADQITLVPDGSLPFKGFNPSEGTFVVEYAHNAGSAVNVNNSIAVEISDNTSATRMIIYNQSGNAGYFIIDGGVTQASNSIGPASTPNQIIRAAMAYKENDFAYSRDGGVALTDGVGTVPTLTQTNVGSSHLGISQLNGFIKSITYFPTRLTNTGLQALSTH